MRKKYIKEKQIELCDIIDEEIKENSLRQGFSKNLIKYSKSLTQKKTFEHKDFTHIPFVTIDGEQSKDFDDAVWSTNKNNKSKVFIAIADVSFYVQDGDPLDQEAKKRGNSFYFPDRVIPMLPEEISNNLCSLNPHEAKKCIIIEAQLYSGQLKSFKIHRGIIKSVGRLTYNQVDDVMFSKKIKSKYFKIIKDLFITYEFLREKSQVRGKLNFERREFEIKEEKKKIIFEKKKKLESYNLIEEFMILANSIIGKILKKNNVKSIYRNHEQPTNEKILNLKKIINEFDIKYRGSFRTQIDIKHLQEIFKKKKVLYLNDFLLKSQSKAYYENKNKGHFGLSLQEYTHFTSPIRRYSDLIVHRDLINLYFKGLKIKKSPNISSHLNLQEKKADSIDRKILDRACSLYLKKFKKYEFRGFIDSIESFGIFISAIDYPFSGLARIRNDRIQNIKRFPKNKKFKTGQLVKFRIKRNNVYNGKILLDKVRVLTDEKKI